MQNYRTDTSTGNNVFSKNTESNKKKKLGENEEQLCTRTWQKGGYTKYFLYPTS